MTVDGPRARITMRPCWLPPPVPAYWIANCTLRVFPLQATFCMRTLIGIDAGSDGASTFRGRSRKRSTLPAVIGTAMAFVVGIAAGVAAAVAVASGVAVTVAT